MFNFDEDDDRLITSTKHADDNGENCLRPRNMTEYIGQEKIKGNLEIFIKAALKRGGQIYPSTDLLAYLLLWLHQSK